MVLAQVTLSETGTSPLSSEGTGCTPTRRGDYLLGDIATLYLTRHHLTQSLVSYYPEVDHKYTRSYTVHSISPGPQTSKDSQRSHPDMSVSRSL